MSKKSTVEKVIFPEITNPEQKAQMIKDNCDSIIPNFSYHKKLTHEELNDCREELGEKMIEVDNLEEELKELSKGLKEKIKPLKKVVKEQLKMIREKGCQITDSVYVLKSDTDYCIYNSEGELIESRPLKESEKQTGIFQTLRKTGTEK
jgi:predicted nuclease with TOPRIM domain